jgi:hypothetical protein
MKGGDTMSLYGIRGKGVEEYSKMYKILKSKEYIEMIKSLPYRRHIKLYHVVDIGEEFALIVSCKNRQTEIVSIIDTDISRIVAENRIILPSNKKRILCVTTLIDEIRNQTYDKNLTLHLVVVLFNNDLPQKDDDIHHKNYFRDNRYSKLQVLNHREHAKLKRNKITTDKEFIEYIREELLGVCQTEFERILRDIQTLIQKYKYASGIYLKNIRLKDTPLSELKDIDDYVELSSR